MKIRVVAFGIAKEIMEGKDHDLDMDVSTVGELKKQLFEKYTKFGKLNSLAFAVNEEYQDEKFELSENDEVVLIPPVAGG